MPTQPASLDSPDPGLDATLGIDRTLFRDALGRHVLLRGVNFSADSKMPATPDGHTYRPSDFSDHRAVSFIGRPAPLEELDTHLSRLRHWGFNCLRLLTTWEAVEHAGPGIYDQAYLEYLEAVCARCGAFGFRVFIDFHQDVWSRMSGGSGAPGWTFEAAGLDFARFHGTGAAHVMQYAYDPRVGGHQDSYPPMSWGSNYVLPANGIMWTLFFAGGDFAPACQVGGENIQHYLQRHYLGAMRAIAQRVVGMRHVIGFDTLNEPGTGYIGHGLDEPITRLRGAAWSPLDGLAVASGLSRSIAVIEAGGTVTRRHEANPSRSSIWLPGRTDPFRANGAWEEVDGDARALRTDYFQQIGTRTVDLGRDYMAPFFGRVAETLRAEREDWLVFVEVNPFVAFVGAGLPAEVPARSVNAAHWYDVAALITKRFSREGMTDLLTGQQSRGPAEIEESYVRQMGRLQALGDRIAGGAPTLLGECGYPFDMNDAEAYRRWAAGERDPAIWNAQVDGLDLMYYALDRLLLSATQWNYTVHNRNDAMIGDGWNQEDLSIWSLDQVTDAEDPDSGGRAIDGFCRPYVRAAQGRILRQRFCRSEGTFEAEIEVDPTIRAPTEIYVPSRQFPTGIRVDASGAEWQLAAQLLRIGALDKPTLQVRITRAG